ncbi:HAD domain-containing protein [Paraburkholderia agricolaris]|uniref:HAD domain-containing protein n=1 Tax=Paraburkholderia agricolaris TaxID=2152888 RepID=A0ABW8ZSK6_9BURK
MFPTSSKTNVSPNSLAIDLQTLGQLVRDARVRCELNIRDAADGIGVSPRVLSRIESGESVGTERLFKVLKDFGLAMLVMQKGDADVVLEALGHTVNWDDVVARQSPATKIGRRPSRTLDRTTPTLFVDYDGTLHAGHALIDTAGQITLDSGRALFEFVPLLVEMLEPYPSVEIVLTTSWLATLPEDKVISYLPAKLARRVVGTTQGRKARFSYLRDGTGRTDIITCYAFGKRLKHWLAIDDSVHGAHRFGSEPGELVRNFVLLDSTRGISDEGAQQRIRDWLVEVHKDNFTQRG